MKPEELAATLECPTIASQLPISFGDDEDTSVAVFGGICSSCNERLDENEIHGTINTEFKGVAVINAAGRCSKCGTVTDLSLRAKKDRSVEHIINGEWVTIHAAPKKSLLKRILGY